MFKRAFLRKYIIKQTKNHIKHYYTYIQKKKIKKIIRHYFNDDDDTSEFKIGV